MSIDDSLLKVTRAEYGPEYSSHLLEQYKLFVEMADRISARRQLANNFFVSINTAILVFLGITGKLGLGAFRPFWIVIVSLAGVVLCYSWYRLIRSYKDLNTGKLAVIHRMEANLPVAPYDAEWVAVGQGKDPKKYLPFTHIEVRIPWIFIALYAVVIVFVICSD
jgi:hypothetical protein